jgi:hypothetical protein
MSELGNFGDDRYNQNVHPDDLPLFYNTDAHVFQQILAHISTKTSGFSTALNTKSDLCK